ncbi:hypothetical protein ACVIWU_000443 [Bradyrhizobium sp. USDA 4509]
MPCPSCPPCSGAPKTRHFTSYKQATDHELSVRHDNLTRRANRRHSSIIQKSRRRPSLRGYRPALAGEAAVSSHSAKHLRGRRRRICDCPTRKQGGNAAEHAADDVNSGPAMTDQARTPKAIPSATPRACAICGKPVEQAFRPFCSGALPRRRSQPLADRPLCRPRPRGRRGGPGIAKISQQVGERVPVGLAAPKPLAKAGGHGAPTSL